MKSFHQKEKLLCTISFLAKKNEALKASGVTG